MAKKIMDRSGVAYDEINIDTNPEHIPFLKEKGIGSAPVIFMEMTKILLLASNRKRLRN